VHDVQARLDGVRERIARAARRAGRDPASVRLIAISKTFSADDVRAAAAAGQLDFGENKVQEALPKMDATADLALTWHLVGHLQSNKAKKAGARFDLIHSIDEPGLIRKLEESARAAGRRVQLLVQADLAGEATKHGARPEQLVPLFTAAAGCTAVHITGLMLLPPFVDDPEQARPYFRSLRTLREQLVASGVDPAQLIDLSMGMSHDFEVAVEEGATMVRVGTAIFGSRAV
jgi:pyridoxal phosphate enzyme (YggS family)